MPAARSRPCSSGTSTPRTDARSMASVATALRRHAPKFLKRLAGRGTGVAIRKAFAAILRCRTGELGAVHWGCPRLSASALGRAKLREPALSDLRPQADRAVARKTVAEVTHRRALFSGHLHRSEGTAVGAALTSERATKRSSKPVPTRCGMWPRQPDHCKTRNWASSESCTHGDET